MTAARWEDKVVDPAVLGVEEAGLPDQLRAFLRWQSARWPRLVEATAALAKVETRALTVGTRAAKMQWNPGRAVSSTAKVDPKSVQARPCFLCAANLPPEEHGLPFGRDLVVLPNPAPILDGHLVVAHREHIPQAIGPALGPAVALAVAARGTLTALYNGPKSGASAPDHLHLQAVTAGVLPEERFAREALDRGEIPGMTLARRDGAVVWGARGAERAIFGIAGPPIAAERAAERLIAALAEAFGTDEPPLNLLATARGGDVVLLVFPRGAHRPACFFTEGPDQRIVSPGVIDMAGIVVTVRESDFRVLDGAAVAAIYGEVSVSGDRLAQLEVDVARRVTDG